MKRWNLRANFKWEIITGNMNRRAQASCRQRLPSVDNGFKFDFFLIEYYCKCMSTFVSGRGRRVRDRVPTDKWKVQKSTIFHLWLMPAHSAFHGNYKIMHFLCPLSDSNHLVHGRFELVAAAAAAATINARHGVIRTIIACQSCRREYFCLNSNSLKNIFTIFLQLPFRFIRLYWISNEFINEYCASSDCPTSERTYRACGTKYGWMKNS